MISDSAAPPESNFYPAPNRSSLEANRAIPAINAIGAVPLAAGRDLTGKMILDYALGSAALLLFAPLLLAIALAVKLDSPGPVFSASPGVA